MQTITFSAIKGGVGKSSLAILAANFLAASGARVLVIDADPQNSATFYYKPDNRDMPENLANIMTGDSILNNIAPTSKGINLIPSSLELINRRNDDINILTVALAEVRKLYDYCIIDTAPNFDNVVINCLMVSDIIVTPVQFSNFDYKSAIFYNNLLKNLRIDDKWKVLFNRFKAVKTGNSLAAQYLSIYNETFTHHILKSRIPESTVIKQYFDTASRISKAKSKLKAYEAICETVCEITGQAATAGAF